MPVDLSGVTDDVKTARGLPNEHYICPETFETERQKVLFANWSAIGFGKDVPEPGDAKPVNFLGVPLLVVRDADGAINVFQNTCRHRGMILIDKPQKVKGVIRCPYHSWCYDLKGALRKTPHVGGVNNHSHQDVPHDEFGLFKVQSHLWMDIVFVNISGTAPAFDAAAADLKARWSEFDQPLYHGGPVSSFKLTVKANWKLAVENYCESYHLPFVHPGLNSYSRIEDHYHIEQPGHFSGQGTRVYRQLKGKNGETFPDFANLTEQWDEGAEYVALYPNVLLGVHRDHTFAIILEPVGLDETVEHVEIYYPAKPGDDDGLADLRAANTKQWEGVFAEDVFVVEGMQAGRHGPMFDGGKFSPAMDVPTHTFHHWVATQLHR